MPALPYLQRPESQSSEKRGYRLSLNDSESKVWRCRSLFNDEEKRVIDNNVNSEEIRIDHPFLDKRNDSSLQLFDRQFTGSARSPRTACQTPIINLSRHKLLQRKQNNKRGLPRWVSELGRWLGPKQKLQLYQSFWRHLNLIDRSKENMLDPFPHVARCEHARTLSALQRQKTRLKLEEEYRESERFERLLERFKEIKEAWEAFQRQADAAGKEHTARLRAFRRKKDHYIDPLDGIREKREERERIERDHQRLLEETRQKQLAKQREIIPTIIITNYDIDLITLTHRESMSSESENEPKEQGDFEEKDGNTKESNQPSSLEEVVFEIPSVVVENLDVNPKEEKEESTRKSLNHLAPPSLSSLDVEDNLIIERNPMLVDSTAGLMTGVVPVPLGISNGLVPDSSIRASSSCDRYHSGAQARLNNIKRSRNGGAWCPKKNNNKQYLEVDLGGMATLMQVATQGYPGDEIVPKKDLRWVQSYTLSFSNDGRKWNSYQEDGAVKVFEGNTDNNTVVKHSLSNPFDARYVRFCPETWRNGIAMRVEVYGNFADDGSSPVEAVIPIPSLPDTENTPERVPSPDPTPLKNPTPPIPSPCPQPVLPPQVTKPPSPIFEVDEKVSEVEQFNCSPDTITPLEGWEEEKVKLVAELPCEEEVEDVEVRLSSPFLNVHGSKRVPKVKRKSKKPKPEKKEKKKKPPKKRKVKLPAITSGMDDLPEMDEEPEPEPEPEEEENEPEEVYRIPTPPLPELSKRPVEVRPSINKRFSMFSPQSLSPSEEEKKKLARARADNSIRDEMLRQQLAEERRKKLLILTDKKRSPMHSLSPDIKHVDMDADSFIFKYCIFKEGQVGYYRRIFESFDEDEDGYLFPEEILEALECVNKNLLDDSHLKYIYRALELCDCSLDSGADFKFFSVVAAFSQKIAALDDYAKIIISKLDFRELDYKLQRAKSLYKCYADENTGQMSMEHLTLELTVGDLDPSTKNHVLRSLGPTTTYLDFLDFLTYIPLFIHIHQHVLTQPLHVPAKIPVR